MLEEFLKYLQYEKNRSAHTVLSYGIDLKQFQKFYEELTGRNDIESAERSDIRHWIVKMVNEKGSSATTIGRKLSSLRIFYKFLIKKGVIEVSPMRNIIPPKKIQPIPAFMTEQEMDRLGERQKLMLEIDNEDDFIGTRDNLIIEMLYQTGMRRIELINLKHADIDFDRKTVRILGKRNKVRYVPFGESLEKQIKEYMELKDKYIPKKEDFLFVIKNGNRLYDKAVYNVVVEKLEPFTTNEKHSPHTLRHTFATVLLNEGADLNVVQKLLGHSSLASTQVYTHTTFRELQEAYKKSHPRA